jgi:hypothetical protein
MRQAGSSFLPVPRQKSPEMAQGNPQYLGPLLAREMPPFYLIQ